MDEAEVLVNIQTDSHEPAEPRRQRFPHVLKENRKGLCSTGAVLPSQLPGARLSARARNLETASLFETVVLPVRISDDIFPLDTQSAAPRVRGGLRDFAAWSAVAWEAPCLCYIKWWLLNGTLPQCV